MANEIKNAKFLDEVLSKISVAMPHADIKPRTYRGGFITTSGKVGKASITFYCDDKKISCTINSGKHEVENVTKEKLEKFISNIISTLRIVS